MAAKKPYSNAGNALRGLRGRAGLSQANVAHSFHVDGAHICRLEGGAISTTVETIEKYLEIVGLEGKELEIQRDALLMAFGRAPKHMENDFEKCLRVSQLLHSKTPR